MKVLLMFSGGMDSIAALEILKKNASVSEIIAHHIYYFSGMGRQNPELQCTALYEKYQSTSNTDKKIGFQASKIDISFLGRPNSDEWTTNLVAAELATRDPTIDAVANGTRQWIPGPEKNQNYWRVFTTEYFHTLMDRKVPLLMPLKDSMKDVAYSHVPKELRNSYWSCRTPVSADSKHTPCGKCKTCQSCLKYKIVHPEIKEDPKVCQAFLDKHLRGCNFTPT